VSEKWVGRPVLRKEDQRFLTGKGQYTADVQVPGALYASFIRSPYAHARIVSIDVSRAVAIPGVVTTLTGDEVKELVNPFIQVVRAPSDQMVDYPIAVGTARHVGEAVAVVVAETPYLAADAAELVDVEYEPLPAVMDAASAMASGAQRVHENLSSNVVWQDTFTYGDVDAAFRDADLVVKDRLDWHRFTSSPLETAVIIASFEPSSGIATIWSNNQQPIRNRPLIAGALRMTSDNLRFICPDIGGGFGIKSNIYPSMVTLVLLARKAGRPVRWTETRREHMQSSTHGQEVVYEAEMAIKKDGTILGVRANAIHDDGAYLRREPIGAVNFQRHATVGYKIASLEMNITAVVTNKSAVGPNRSYGKMQHCFMIERLIDQGARQLGIDPSELRLRNFVQPEEMPYQDIAGRRLDGGDYPGMMHRALEIVGYDARKAERTEARASGRLIGIGVAMGMDACPMNTAMGALVSGKAHTSGDSEAAWVNMDEFGRVTASTGSVNQGQGFETSVAQLVADGLGVTPDDVHALRGFDSATHAHSAFSGTYASRFAIVGAPAVVGAAQKVALKIRQIAGHLLEVSPDEIELVDGRARVRGSERGLTLREIAHVAWRDLNRLPDEIEAGLYGHFVYRPKFDAPMDGKRGNFSFTYSYSMTVVVVEIDLGTGKVAIRRLVSLDDFGRRINPLIVDGQIHGAIGHQLGAALYERLHYDADGQLLSASFKDYWAPTAADMPDYEVEYFETPSTASPLGTRGGGEGGGSPLIAAVNAVDDALSQVGAHLTGSYLDPETILNAIRDAKVASPTN
jgi:2-furoyl-CoA dehydrogenase large subunit